MSGMWVILPVRHQGPVHVEDKAFRGAQTFEYFFIHYYLATESLHRIRSGAGSLWQIMLFRGRFVAAEFQVEIRLVDDDLVVGGALRQFLQQFHHAAGFRVVVLF